MSHRTLVLSRAVTPTQYQAAHELRRRRYREALGYEAAGPEEVVRDHAGLLFLLSAGDQLVATGRCLRATSGLTGVESLGLLPDHFKSDDVVEISRLAASPVRNARIPYGFALLLLGATWLTNRTPMSRYIAWCRPRIAPVYERVGARQLAEGELEVSGTTTGFVLMAGELADVARLATQLLPADSVLVASPQFGRTA